MWGDYDNSGGGGFIQSQPGASSSNQPGGAKKGGNSTSLVPCAISHVLMASPGGQDGPQSGGLMVNEVELHTVCVCGIVRKIEVANTNITYVIDDYSAPPIEIKQWVDPSEEDAMSLNIAENDYVRVFGSVRSFKGVRNIVSFKIEKLQDMNEMTLHLIETMHAHLAIQKRHLTGPSSTTAHSYSANASSHVAMDTNIPDQGLSGTQKQVYEIITAYKSDIGISSSEIKALLPGASQNEVKKAIEFLSDEGHIYSTIDEDHFRSTSAEC